MKIICNTARLNEACQNVQRAVSSKATMPAIEGILMKAEAGQVQLTGYDMDMGITTVQEARVEEDGAIVLNARLLCDILRRLPGETVSIEADPRQLCTIRCGEVEYQLVGIDAKEYPELPTVTEEVPVLIDSETLEKMVLIHEGTVTLRINSRTGAGSTGLSHSDQNGVGAVRLIIVGV
ncbi:MAG: DNA polymerase III subunit beta, partial [Clostridia bacterium]|nr:DNA polymerase III subunit beta [Clostridia bacterium]